jgi:hypothetical protein
MVDVGTVVDVLLEERGMEIALCDYGLHGSRRMRDAYSYFRGSYLTRTLHYGHIEEGAGQARQPVRECIGMIDVRSPIGREIMELIAFQQERRGREEGALSDGTDGDPAHGERQGNRRERGGAGDPHRVHRVMYTRCIHDT